MALASANAANAQSAPTATSTYATCAKTPSKAEVEAAHGAYLAGRHSFDEGDYATAITYFKDAYRRDCTKHELLPIIARAYELGQNRAEAIVALETFIKRVPPNEPTLDAIKKRIANLKQTEPKSATPPPPPAPTPTPTSQAPANPEPAPPSTTTSPAQPAPAHDEGPERKLSPLPWVLVGVGGVGAVVGSIVLASGLSERSDAIERCPNESNGSRECPENVSSKEANEQFQSGTTQAMVGGIVLGASVLAIGGGLLWHVLDRNAGAKSTSRRTFVPIVASSARAPAFGATYVSSF